MNAALTMDSKRLAGIWLFTVKIPFSSSGVTRKVFFRSGRFIKKLFSSSGMTKTSFFRSGLFISTLFFVVLAKANDKQLLLDELYESARLEQQLQWVQTSMTLQTNEYALPRDVVNIMNQMVKIRYSPGYFRSAMTATLDEALSMGELENLIQWYSSPLGQKILKLETEANDPTNAQVIQAYIEKTLSRQPPRNDRLILIESLMEVLDTVDLSTELAASASVGAQRLLREVMPRPGGKPVLSANILKSREKPTIRKNMAKRMQGVFLYTYRSLPDHEIRQYLQFASDNAMRNFQRGQIQAMARML